MTYNPDKYRVPSTTNVSGNGADPISDEAQDRAAQVTSPHGSGSARGSAANSARGSAVNKAYNGHVQTMGTTMTQPHTTRRSSTPQTLTKVLTTITPATARVGTTGSPKIGSRSPTALVSPTIPSDAAAVALQRAYSVNTRRAPGDEGYRIVDPRENTPQLPVQTRSPGQAQQATTQMKAYRRPPPTPPVPYAKSRSDECVVESGESVGKHTDVGAKPGLR
ncbi:hypothetical protein SARC_07379 [Sphaeroforma arctica JP610]|uniref:Uncharacterized protein n=1 Tax=Sphaeroforma arctica JP610 TaxID=667725 RepID=A0A0L0FUM7_9EUKA|nr:hypothetical protein SARC_07379 [Sphaeroforma arctica JP610]KNC80256.1 hypothetical protein SARC_07379 [Sphaeroforma arctica JP610]|eukprot:XP_014154158.1 hypothetical protein SARC_07379 [Sphaeroforma arctica JP610]